MSFELVSPQKIRHQSGYIVQGGDRFHLEYIENDKVLVIPVEDRIEENYEIYWEKISSWEPPFDHITLSNDELKRIQGNVLSALEFEKI
jgi:hypothetical protein